MSGFPDSGGLFPEGRIEDRWDLDDRGTAVIPCNTYRAHYPRLPWCWCGVHRSAHFAATIEAATGGEWTRYATLLEGRKR